MRSKEEAHDYRYFPEPDLVPVILEDEFVTDIKNSLPELPAEKFRRYLEEFGLPEYDAELITADRDLAEYFEAVVAIYNKDYKAVSNWIMGEFMRLMNEQGIEVGEVKIKPEDFAAMLKLMDEGVISSKIAKVVFEEMFNTGKEPKPSWERKVWSRSAIRRQSNRSSRMSLKTTQVRWPSTSEARIRSLASW